MISRIELEPGFVLHRRPYRETSLLVEAFTHEHGRVGLVARGARRRRSSLRDAGVPFRPLLLSWSAGGDLGTLTHAEARGPARGLGGRALASGFYLNELLLRLLARHDPHPELFAAYALALEQIGGDSAGGGDPQPALRVFEKRLLDAVGYGLVLDRAVDTGAAVRPEQRYTYRPLHGPVARAGHAEGVPVSGRTLLALAREELVEADVLREAKRLMRRVLDEQLGGRPLRSREMLGPGGR